MGRPKGAKNLVPQGLNPASAEEQGRLRFLIASHAKSLIILLISHANGTKILERDSQVSAAFGLLRKILPDLVAIDVSAHSPPQRIAEAVLKARLSELIRSDPAMLGRLAEFVGLPTTVAVVADSAHCTAIEPELPPVQAEIDVTP